MALMVPIADLTGHSEWFEPVFGGSSPWNTPVFSKVNDSENTVTASTSVFLPGDFTTTNLGRAILQLTANSTPSAGTVTFRFSVKTSLTSGAVLVPGSWNIKIGPSTLIQFGHLHLNRVFQVTDTPLYDGNFITGSYTLSAISPALITAWGVNNDWADLVVSLEGLFQESVFGTDTTVKFEFGYVELEVPSLVPPPTPPTAPSGLTCTKILATQVNLSWTDNSNNETNFEIDRAIGVVPGAYSALTSPGANATTYSDLTTYGGETFNYRIRAVNSAGNSAYDTESIAIAMPWYGTPEPTRWKKKNPTPPTTPVPTWPIFWDGIYYPSGTQLVWSEITAPSDEGWWFSLEQYAGNAAVVSNTRPTNPRSYVEVAAFATGSASTMGGFPGVAGTFQNRLVYADGGYVVGTDQPTIRMFDGNSDREVCVIPKTAAGAVPKAVMSILVTNGTIYISTLDSGTDATDWAGRVFELTIETGQLTPIGTPFTGGHVPYALAWHAGRLWCGTNTGDPTVEGTIRFFRPGVDSDWTTEHTLAVGCVSALLSYKGLLYVGCTAPAASFALVLVRSAANAYSTSLTTTGGTAAANNAILSMAEFDGNLYAGFWNADTPSVAKIYKFDNASWSTAYTGSGDTIVPFVGLASDNDILYAIGGSMPFEAVLLTTANGTAWNDRTVFLPQSDDPSTGLNAFGVVVL